MTQLKEGLRGLDLIDLVKETVSIDEYESKIDDDAIVVGFYVDDKEPANDLSMFIESGGGDIIDTEVSPSTNNHGDYMVFVEFLRDEKFPENLKFVLETVENLTGIKDWSYTYYGGNDNITSFDSSVLSENVRLGKKEPVKQEEKTKNENREFFKNSILDDVYLYGNKIIIERRANKKTFELIAMGDEELLTEMLSLDTKPFAMDFKSLRECNGIRKMLGENWDVNKIDNHYILANNTDTRIMVVK